MNRLHKNYFAVALLVLILALFASSPAEAAFGDLLNAFVSTYPNIGGLAVDSNGEIYVTAGYNQFAIQVYDKQGTLLRQWGNYGAWGAYSYDGESAHGPNLIAIDKDNNVYVHDSGYVYAGGTYSGYFHRIQVYNTTGTLLRTWYVSKTVDDYWFSMPRGMAVDASGNVYLAIWDGTIQVYTGTGTLLRQFASGYWLPNRLFVDLNGDIYVTYLGDVARVFSNTGAYLRQIGVHGTGVNQIYNPYGIAVDSYGHVFIADLTSNRVQLYSDAGEFLQSWAGAGYNFSYPGYLALDASGNVYVSDQGFFTNDRVLIIEGFASCKITANAGSAQALEQTSPAGAYVVLNGTAITQGCAGDLTYAWSWQGGSATGAAPTVLMSAGTRSVTLTVQSGTVSATDTVVITVQDTQKPTTTTAVSGIMGNNGWYTSDVLISLSSWDAGSGVKEIRHSVDGAETIVPGNSAAVTISTEGIHSFTYYAVDNAGNKESVHTLSIKIDKTPPVTQATLTGAFGTSCYGSDVNVALSALDNLSGVAATQYRLNGGPWQAYSGLFTVAAEGAYALGYASTDKAGNSETEKLLSFTIDKTPPEAIIKFDPASKDLKVYNSETGAEASYVVLPSKHEQEDGERNEEENEGQGELRQYTLLDCANNSLVLTLRYKREEKEIKAGVLSMQYNNGPVHTAVKNKIQAEYEQGKDGAIKELEQKAAVKNQFEVEAKYGSRKNETRIEAELQGQKETKETRPGMTILELLTDKGGLTYRY